MTPPHSVSVTDDVVLMPPHTPPVVGRQGVIDWFATVVSQARTTSVEIDQREVTLAGSWQSSAARSPGKLRLPSAAQRLTTKAASRRSGSSSPMVRGKSSGISGNMTLPLPAFT